MRYLHEQIFPTSSSLNQAVGFAWRNNAFYRNKLRNAGIQEEKIHNVEHLKHLPYTHKEELQVDPWILLSVPRQTLIQANISTEVLAEKPLYILYDSDDLFKRGLMPLMERSSGTNMLRIYPGEIVFNALPYEVTVEGLAMHCALQDGIGACIVPVGQGGYYSDPEKTLKMMREIRGDHILITPAYAIFLADYAEKLGVQRVSELGIKSLWIIGESCSQGLRKRIESLWACPVYKYYGSMECGPIGVECRMQDGYHLATNFVCTEIDVDACEYKNPVNVGEIIATTLWRHASPLIRYRTGDIGYIDSTICKCGLQGSRLHLLGNKEDILKIDGKTLLISDIEDALFTIPGICAWFRLRVECERLYVVLISTTEARESNISKEISIALQHSFGIKSLVEFVSAIEYTGGKFTRLIK